MITFKSKYDKNKFYSLMGRYFAEREYKILMPYLVNEPSLVWNILIENDEVVGFINYKELNNKIKIGYCYSVYPKIIEKLLKTVPNTKAIEIVLEKHFDKSLYENIGYTIYKESTNYWYMELNVNEKIYR